MVRLSPRSTAHKIYQAYHEMDIRQFVDCMNARLQIGRTDSRLKQLRRLKKYSQSQLAKASGIPLRSIQQYEQGKKDLSKAQTQAVIRLARALDCEVCDLAGIY